MPSTIRVLVVEDEPLLRMDIADQLAERGFDVVEASNAREALGVLAVDPTVQLMFTDVDMPGGPSGVELANQVRERWPDVRIIVTSGNQQVPLAVLPKNSRFFGKPYVPSQVANAMTEMTA